MSKPDSSKTPNQDIYNDDQNFNVDINKLSEEWLTSIDNLRSYSKITIQNNEIISSMFKNGDITESASLIKMEQTPQESRCHAFYRWIGFPVVNKNYEIYNPGFDIIRDKNRKIKKETKLAIAKTPIDNFSELSIEREDFASGNLDIFINPRSIDAGILALSNGGTNSIRKFVVPLNPEKNDDPFDMESENQSFQVDMDGTVGEKIISLKEYQNDNGNKSTKFSLFEKRKHIIKPFIVDARIDLSVTPQFRLIAVPFVPDKSYTQVDPVHNIKRPLIEKIIRDKISLENKNSDAGTSVNDILTTISELPDFADNKLIQKVKDIYDQSEQSKFIQAIKIITSVLQQLADAKNTIKEIQGKYYWLPAPSISGPEGGSSVQGVFLASKIDSQLIPYRDEAILKSKAETILNSATSEGSQATGAPSAADFGLPTETVTFEPDTTSALGDNAVKNQELLSEKRFNDLTKANDALKVIELIMGDFSGLGLCDIIAIISALNIMPKEKLIGFLDADAKIRMTNSTGYTDNANISYNDAMKELFLNVQGFYNLMDTIYINYLYLWLSYLNNK